MDGFRVGLLGSSVDSSLELEDFPLDLGPGKILPDIHPRGCLVAHAGLAHTGRIHLLFLRGPVSISPGFPRGLGFWAHPTPRSHAPDRLLLRGEAAEELLRSRGRFDAVFRAALFAGLFGVKTDQL